MTVTYRCYNTERWANKNQGRRSGGEQGTTGPGPAKIWSRRETNVDVLRPTQSFYSLCTFVDAVFWCNSILSFSSKTDSAGITKLRLIGLLSNWERSHDCTAFVLVSNQHIIMSYRVSQTCGSFKIEPRGMLVHFLSSSQQC